jgi:hypothetical protein
MWRGAGACSLAGVAALAGCIVGPSPVVVEQQGSSSSAGDDVCPADRPPLGCPYTGSFGACGENPSSELDESCCRRPYCKHHADCDVGMVCSYGGIYSFGCEEVAEDGASVCICGADPLALGRPMCMPPAAVDPDWCTQLRSPEECGGAGAGEWTELGSGDVRRCGWVDVEEVRFDTEAQSCARVEALPRCVTLRQPEGNGCSPDTCTLGDDPAEILGPVAQPLDANSYEMIAAGETLCGVGTPVGDWLPAEDVSLGPCALACPG